MSMNSGTGGGTHLEGGVDLLALGFNVEALDVVDDVRRGAPRRGGGRGERVGWIGVETAEADGVATAGMRAGHIP